MLDEVHVHDASARRRDPTDTGVIRRKFRAAVKFRLGMLRAQMCAAVVDKDILGLTAESGTQHHPADVRLSGFNAWMTYTTNGLFNTTWYRHFIELAWMQGEQKAQEELHLLNTKTTSPEHALQRTKMEIQGISAALVQVVSRAAADVTKSRHNRRYRVVQKLNRALDTTARVRFIAMTNTMVVNTFNEAKLEIYRQNGVSRVGINPEYFKRDAVTQDALVGFQTAGDEYVCQVCDDYASGSPYQLDEVETSLHANCRCEVIPWNED